MAVRPNTGDTLAEERGGNNSDGVGIGVGVGKAERTNIPGWQVAAPGGGWRAMSPMPAPEPEHPYLRPDG